MALALDKEAMAEEVEFVTADGVAQFDADFEEEFGDFSEESIRVVAGSGTNCSSGFSNDSTC